MNSFQNAFFKRLDNGGADVGGLFDHVPGLCYFVKDLESRLVTANRLVVVRLGLASDEDLAGRMDAEFFPEQIVKGFETDDQQVFQTGRPVVNRVEPWKSEGVGLRWCLTTKYPLFDAQKNVVGLAGITQPEPNMGEIAQNSRIKKVVEYIEKNFANPISIEDICRENGISSRQLNRNFQQEFGMSVREFLTRTRVFAAANILTSSDLTIGEIAMDTGFTDQSALARTFKKFMGCTPNQFRSRR